MYAHIVRYLVFHPTTLKLERKVARLKIFFALDLKKSCGIFSIIFDSVARLNTQ